MTKWIIMVMSEAVEVFEGSESAAQSHAFEMWLESVDQDYGVEPYSKKAAKDLGLEDEDA
jgi:hypothetical protein